MAPQASLGLRGFSRLWYRQNKHGEVIVVSALRSRRVSNSLEAANQVKPLPLFGEERELRMRTENSAVSVNRNRMSLPIRENSRIFELQKNRLYKLRPLETTKHTKRERTTIEILGEEFLRTFYAHSTHRSTSLSPLR